MIHKEINDCQIEGIDANVILHLDGKKYILSPEHALPLGKAIVDTANHCLDWKQKQPQYWNERMERTLKELQEKHPELFVSANGGNSTDTTDTPEAG